MEQDEKLIREWEQRYKSYRQYRTQHLITTILATAAVVLGLAFAVSEKVSSDARVVILASMCAVLAAYVIARVVAIRAMKALGERIKWLEDEIGMEAFQTIAQLQKSIPVTLYGGIVILGFSVYLLLSQGFGGDKTDILEQRDEMIRYAYMHRGVPYQWGGDGLSTGLDCSGFVRCVLQEFELLPDGDYDAQMLLEHYSDYKTRRMKPGNLIFFGEDDSSITHVGILVDHMRMIDASKGNSRTKSLGTALSRGAGVRVAMLNSRANRVAVVDPFAQFADEAYWPHVKVEDSVRSHQLLEFPEVVIGDVNATSDVDIVDILFVIGYVFYDGTPPSPLFSGDADCTGEIDYDDVVYLIEYLFSGGCSPCSVERDDSITGNSPVE
jgi:hypothetical protein